MLDVLVLAYKRPENLRAVLSAVHRARVGSLTVTVDGPRVGDELGVAATRAVVDEFVWDCPVRLRFHPTNLGVKHAMMDALDDFFQHHSFGVVLEDDCFPAPDFFRFFSYAAEAYSDRKEVGMVSGTNFLQRYHADITDILYTEGHIWGWGTWSDRWGEYRAAPTYDPIRARKYYGPGWPYRRMLIKKAEAGNLDSWAIPWLYDIASRGLLCVTPSVNLVTNVGHNAGGTHTSGRSRFANLPLFSLGPEIRDTRDIQLDRGYRLRYAAGLGVEHIIHSARRPVVRTVRRFVSAARGRLGLR